MTRFNRKIGKRFFRRFDTDSLLIEKDQVGSEGRNITVTADADRRAELVLNTAHIDPAVAGAFGEIAYLAVSPGNQGFFSGNGDKWPNSIRLNSLTYEVQGTEDTTAIVFVVFQVTGAGVDPDGTLVSPITVFRHIQKGESVVPDTSSVQVHNTIPIGVEVPLQDINTYEALDPDLSTFLQPVKFNTLFFQFNGTIAGLTAGTTFSCNLNWTALY